MKFWFIILGIFLYSCTGNFGKFEELQNTRCIEQYQYSTIPLDTMYSYINTIYENYPEIKAYPEDSLNYTFEYGKRWYYLKILNDAITYELEFSFSIDPYNSEEDKRMCVMSLTSGRKKGGIMKEPHKLSLKEKELFKKLFEEEFLTKLDSTFQIQWENYSGL